MDLASIDSMDLDEFAALSAAILGEIPSGPSDRHCDDRRAILSDAFQQLLRTPKVHAIEELGDAEMTKRIANRRGNMNGSLNPDQARANIENLHVAVIKVLGWAGADKDNIEELAEQFDSVVANSADVVQAVSAWFDKFVPTNTWDARGGDEKSVTREERSDDVRALRIFYTNFRRFTPRLAEGRV